MSYQVLARKYRPRRFEELIGQEHVQKALKNALDSDRLHHAYLFTGTRGVGKTTIARILSRCLNCDHGVSSSPCGNCSTCREIDEGRFVDLIEVDAASRTKVEDTRELLENVQYAPTRGRYKVYLIDEVHMLSAHSFNALLKTLEEPPPHVKFLLATTDPQKLPITVLSRCLQFNLKAMTAERIVGHLHTVLEAEKITHDEGALWELARAAQGSMRDALSLTDQAIAHGAGVLTEPDVRSMLGTVDRQYVWQLGAALGQGDAKALLAAVAAIAENAPDWTDLLAGLISLLHRVTVAQLVPDSIDDARGDRSIVMTLAAQLSAADLQLFYQTALLGRRDLPLAPDPRAGLEMTLLRMLAFRPAGAPPHTQSTSTAPAAGSAHVKKIDAPLPVNGTGAASVAVTKPLAAVVTMPIRTATALAPATPAGAALASTPMPSGHLVPLSRDWDQWVAQLKGLPQDVLALARNSALEARHETHWELVVAPGSDILIKDPAIRTLETSLSTLTGAPTTLRFIARPMLGETPRMMAERRTKEKMAAAEKLMHDDDNVRDMIKLFNAKIMPGSLKIGESSPKRERQ